MRRVRGGARAGVRLSGCLLSVCLLLAGCSDPEPSPTPTPSPSSSSMVVSPSPSESSSAPPRAETPVQFIKRWIELGNQMQVTGDTTGFRGVSRSCEPCDSLAQRVEGIYRAGGWVQTDGWRLLKVRKIAGTKEHPVVDVEVLSSPTTFVEELDGEEQSFPGGKLIERFELVKVRKEWRMQLYSELSQ